VLKKTSIFHPLVNKTVGDGCGARSWSGRAHSNKAKHRVKNIHRQEQKQKSEKKDQKKGYVVDVGERDETIKRKQAKKLFLICFEHYGGAGAHQGG